MEAIADRLKIKNAAELPGKFAQMNHDLGLPSQLRDLLPTKEDLAPLAIKAKEDHCTGTNPRPLSIADCSRLYQEAW